MIYLLHSTVQIGGAGSAGARHYLGYCYEENLGQRIYDHQHGRNTSGLVRAGLAKGGQWLLVRTWPLGTPALEKYLKQRGHMSLHCPLCHPEREVQGWQLGKALPSRSRVPSHPHYEKPTTANGGGALLGSLTGSVGYARHGRHREPGTWSAVAQATALAESGGSGSSVTALPGRSITVPSAGTRLRYGSTLPGDERTTPTPLADSNDPARSPDKKP